MVPGISPGTGSFSTPVTDELLKPRLWYLPAAIAMKPEFGAGMLHWPSVLSPQATILPPGPRPRLCAQPPPTFAASPRQSATSNSPVALPNSDSSAFHTSIDI